MWSLVYPSQECLLIQLQLPLVLRNLREGYDHDGTPADPVPLATGRDDKYYPYLATIMPDGSKDKVVIRVGNFTDLVKTQGEGTAILEPGEYRMPSEKAAMNGRDKLEVTVEKAPAAAKEAGLTVGIPNDIIIPANGYLVVAKDDGDGDDNHEKRTDSTAVVYPGDPKDADIMDNERQPAQRIYNVIKADLPNLEGPSLLPVVRLCLWWMIQVVSWLSVKSCGGLMLP